MQRWGFIALVGGAEERVNGRPAGRNPASILPIGSLPHASCLQHDPEKWIPVFGKACPRARPEGSCPNNKVERDDDSNKSHLALGDEGIVHFQFDHKWEPVFASN